MPGSTAGGEGSHGPGAAHLLARTLLPLPSGRLWPRWVPAVEMASPSCKTRTWSQLTCKMGR